MRIKYNYQQRAVVDISGVLEVPDDVVDKGGEALNEYIRENEKDASSIVTDIIEWLDEVPDTMETE